MIPGLPRTIVVVAVAAAFLAFATPALSAKVNVAVFNFQMKSDTPRWKWVEKGLADQITTDFTRSRRIAVVARDEMQLLARKMRWTPELATSNSPRMAQIRKILKLDQLVTGVYSVDGEDITITAQIIRVHTRKEVARKKVTGKVADILSLQKRLSAELLSWFSGVPAEKILPHLPLWTRSVRATQALYEGLHLYDEGRYAEAWMKFRLAVRNDPEYLESHYWVARMYYFMDRYEHARRSYERFIYQSGTHPRIGDAIKEYLHTYEKLDTAPQTLLELYADFILRFPEVMIYNELNVDVPVTTRAWLRARSSQMLAHLGRFEESTLLASKSMEEVAVATGSTREPGWGSRIAINSADYHNKLTGKVILPKGLAQRYMTPDGRHMVLRFAPGKPEAIITFKTPRRVWETTGRDGRIRYRRGHWWCYALAPDGYVFRKITFYPLVEGDDGTAEFVVAKDGPIKASERPVSQATKHGFAYTALPRTGLLQVSVMLKPNDPFRDPNLRFHGLRAVAELEKLGRHGSLHVSCSNTNHIVVYLNGLRLRKGAGLMGLIPPGSHDLEVRSGPDRQPYRKKIVIRPGETTRVIASLPWKASSPLRTWTAGTFLGRDYPGHSPFMQRGASSPAIQMDQEAIRVFWSYLGDLWFSTSTDGEKFSRPAKLPMPISTGWAEQDPLCFRDESGRFVLVFTSDREAQHRERPYVSWSRDAVHWSRPAMITDTSIEAFDMIQDERGRFTWVGVFGKKATILGSRNMHNWEELAVLPTKSDAAGVKLLQRDDGALELFVQRWDLSTKVSPGESPLWARYYSEAVIRRFRSADGRKWSPGVQVARLGRGNRMEFSVAHVRGRTLLVSFFRTMFLAERRYWPIFSRESLNETWEISQPFRAIDTGYGTMEYHPRWGYAISWYYPSGTWFLAEESGAGPYLMRGQSVEPFFRRREAPKGR